MFILIFLIINFLCELKYKIKNIQKTLKMATNDGNLNNQNQQIDTNDEELVLENNMINQVKTDNNINWTNIRSLKLYKNDNITINPFAFKGLSNLKTLIFESNKIDQISTNAFSSLINLGTLKLFGNIINRIDSKSFQSPVNLKILIIEKNIINTIESDALLKGSILTGLNLKELNLGKIKIEFDERALDLNKNKFGNLIFNNSIEITENKLRVFLSIFRDSSNLEQIKCENNYILLINKSSKRERIKSNEYDCFGIASDQVHQTKQLNPLPRNLSNDLNNLEILNLYEDDYKLISDQTFGKLSNLKQLHIEHTKIDSIVPNAFSDLVSLESLKLSNNYIFSINENAFNNISCELKELILENNTFGYIFKKAFSNSNGEILKIHYDNNGYVKKISVHHLSKINKIKLENNVFQTEALKEHVNSDSKNDSNINKSLLNEFVKRDSNGEKSDQIPRKKFELINLTSLKTLNLSSNQIGKIESILFERSFQVLEFLDLSYNNFKKFNRSIIMLSNMKFLDLSHNQISDFDSNHSNNQSNLDEFYLLCNQFKNLSSMSLIRFDNLHTLNLYGNRISNIEEKTFDNFPKLKRLSLGNNKLTVIRSFFFRGLDNLEILWLNDNFISEVDANCFSLLPNLRELNLSGNEINETEILRQLLNNQIALDLTRNLIEL